MIELINILLGGALLLAGRKLFWLFVGGIGFVTGLQFAANFWQGPDTLTLVFGSIVGVIFAVLFIIGVTVQGSVLRSEQPARKQSNSLK